MGKGFEGVRDAAKDVEERRAAGGSGQGAIWFKLPDSGDEAIVRFLEDEPTWCYMHEIPVAGRSFGDDVPCLDQEKEGIDCPGCEADLKRKFKGYINLLWDEAPVFKRDDEGKIVKDRTGDVVISGHKEQVAIWTSGIRVFEELDEANINYRGLTSRPFKVKRKGTGLDTKYVITPEDPDGGKKAMTAKQKKLAKEPFDLNVYVTPPEYEEFEKRMDGGGRRSSSSDSKGSKNGSGRDKVKNPFLSRKPDDEDE